MREDEALASFKYDVFLCHSSKDKPIVRELAERLRGDGLRVWFEDWELGMLDFGQRRESRVEQALVQSRALILVMSQNAFASEWGVLRSQTALFRDLTDIDRRFIPLQLDDTMIDETLKPFAFIDWRNQSSEQYAQLLAACRSGLAGASFSNEEGKLSPAKVLTGHAAPVLFVTTSLDNRLIISCSTDRILRVWDIESGKVSAVLAGHSGRVYAAAVTADGQQVISGSEDKSLRVWNIATGRCFATYYEHADAVSGVVIMPDGRRILSSSADQTIRLWDLHHGYVVSKMTTGAPIYSLAITADGWQAVVGCKDGMMYVFEVNSGRLLSSFMGHSSSITSVAISASGHLAISGSYDQTVRVWDLKSSRLIAILEGHTGVIWGVAITADGRRAISSSGDSTLRVWDLQTGRCVDILKGHRGSVYSVALTPDGQKLVSGSNDRTIRIWDFPMVSVDSSQSIQASRYTNAKVLLVGDSGAGKSGLAYRLAENRFVPTISTDSAWATQLKIDYEEDDLDIEREVWLWDFAGQADRRLIHQLYMDEAALALLVFDPQSENPFEGLGQWNSDLSRAARRPFQKLLVAGRCDRGGLMVSNAGIERFRRDHGFAAYLETSALTGIGCSELREAIIRTIPWKEIPWTSSPRVFRLLKEQIIKLRDEGKDLLRMVELKQQLEMRLSEEFFTPEDLRAVVGLLAGPGVVWQLEFGDFVLLHPERINAYAAAVIRKVRAHAEEIGCILEESMLEGDLDYQDMRRLSQNEEQIVLRAMHQTFVNHGLCLRERSEQGMLLIFPSYFKRERPDLQDYPAALVSYRFSGSLDEIYSTLVVRLHHTITFDKYQLWRFAADFKTPSGKRVGFKMTKKGEGKGELVVYFEPGVTDDTKVTFIRYVHEHLWAKASDVVRFRHYTCLYCHTSVENHKTVLDRLTRGLQDIICVNCERRVPLWDLIEEKFASEEFKHRVRELEEQARKSIDNESRELILIGHAFAIAGEAGQIFRPTPNSDWGIDGEIEFKDLRGKASGQRIYLQLKSGDSYLYKRREDGEEVFTIKNLRHVEYWQKHAYPVMLVVRTGDGEIRWMNMTESLQKQAGKKVKQIIFKGEPFTALNLQRLRDRVLAS